MPMQGIDPMATAPHAGSESVITPGGEAWQIVPPSALHQLPFSAIGRLELYGQGGLYGAGTAWLVGRSTGITAAHNFRPPAGGAIQAVKLVLPGLGVTVAVADARLHPYFRSHAVLVDLWDIAAIRIAPLDAPFLGLATPPPSGVFPVRIAGFPRARDAMVVHTERALRASAQLLVHRVDTGDGHSGAPVLQGGNSAIGVHVGGTASNPMPQHYPSNTALPFGQELTSFIQSHLNAWG
jgi:hypothetical protein